jgi:hypothetical protein
MSRARSARRLRSQMVLSIACAHSIRYGGMHALHVGSLAQSGHDEWVRGWSRVSAHSFRSFISSPTCIHAPLIHWSSRPARRNRPQGLKN